MEQLTAARPRISLKADWVWLWLSGAAYLAALLLSGCGGGDAEGSGREGTAGTSSGGASGASGGSSGSSGAAGQGGSGAFGNPDGPPPMGVDGGSPDASGREENPDDIKCGGTEVVPMVKMETIPGNILLVFDRSGSMEDPYPATGNPKWEDARDAVTRAIEPLQESINVGAIFFPHQPACPNNSCCVPAYGTAPQIDFMPGSDFLAAWDSFWASAPVPRGSTPTLEALEVADQALAATAGMLEGATAVVVITDGDPRCAVQGARANNPTAAEIQNQVTRLSVLPAQWQAQGIDTHVVGIPGADAPHAITVLDAMASAGGTTQHISAADPAALQTELANIVGESVSTSFDSCSVELPRVPPNRNDVVLVVVESGREQSVARDLGDSGGWTLTPDGLTIILQGDLCLQARAGAYDKISVVFGCVELPPLPPPPKPD